MPQLWCNVYVKLKVGGSCRRLDDVECDTKDVVVKMLTVLMHLHPIFLEQMQGRLPAHIAWHDVTQYWGQKVKGQGVEMYRMILELAEGLLPSHVTNLLY